MAAFGLSATNFDNALDKYYREAPKTVMEVIHGDGAELIKGKIREIIPVSSREKRTHAKAGARFRQENKTFSTTLIIGGKYGYLYFPDEGVGKHNPTAHDFMRKGAVDVTPDICKMIESRVGAL